MVSENMLWELFVQAGPVGKESSTKVMLKIVTANLTDWLSWFVVFVVQSMYTCLETALPSSIRAMGS